MKVSLYKRIQFLLFHKCPNCGKTITTSWYSFIDMKQKYKCDNCGKEYV